MAQQQLTNRRMTRPSRHRRLALSALLATILAIGAIGSTEAPDAAAQAQQVHTSVHIAPEFPAVGDDVAVDVDVTGCPAGRIQVEVYLATTDGATQQAALMAAADATTSLLLRSKAQLVLTAANEGWYGVRVVCGNFRPPKQPMASSRFAVGLPSDRRVQLASSTAPVGGTLGLFGDRCIGTSIEYDLTEGIRYPGAFEPDGSAAVTPDGSWLTTASIAATAAPGPATIRVRCVTTSPFGETIYSYYDGWTSFEIVAG